MFATNNEPRHENANNIFLSNPIHCVLSDGDLLNNSLHVRTGRFLECDITMVKYLLSKYELVIPLKLQRIKNKIGLQQW